LHLSKGGWSLGRKDLLSGLLGSAVGKREIEVLGEELFDVRAADKVGLLDFDNFQDLDEVNGLDQNNERENKRTWIDLNRDLWRAAISWYRASTASVRDISRYSLYMLWVPERES
jgi:hypothetical protein